MKHSPIYISIIIGLFLTINLQSQSIDQAKLNTKIESLIPPAVNDSTPGFVLGVIQKGELIFSKGYGLANLSYNIPNDPKMAYNIGSVSKQFLGYAFAMLHVEGKLNINEPVSKYLEDWPEFDKIVTLKHLLNHTSGYREAYTISGLAGRDIGVDHLSRSECLNVVRKQPKLEFEPGSQFTYNSTAWVILAEILEKVTGQPADKWVEVNILSPLEMKNTYIESFVGEVIPNAAESYNYNKNKGYVNSKSNRAIFGAADINTSIEDLTKWINNFKTIKAGGKEAMELFLTPFNLDNNPKTGYALGIQVGFHKGVKFYSHTGGHASFVTQLRYYPEQEIGIINISNFGGKGAISTGKIAEFLLEAQMKPKKEKFDDTVFEMDKNELVKFAGIYISPTFNKTTPIVIKNDTLVIWDNSKLIPTSPNSFRTKNWDGKFEIITQADGKLQLEIIGDSKTIYTKATNSPTTLKELTEYEGDYWSEEIETIYHLKIESGKLIIKHRWLGEIKLEPITKDLFKDSWGWYLKVERSEENNITGFNMNSNRTLNVFFKRKE
jgi:CubicO group peptidase (beta-lactamase class C family)